jgi:hypothetical protein
MWGMPCIVKTIEPEELADKTGYTRPHTVHCGPGWIYVTALGKAEGKALGSIFLMDHESFAPLDAGRWSADLSSSLTTPGGVLITIRWSPANGVRPIRSRTD